MLRMSRGSHFATLVAGIVLALAAPAAADAAKPVPSLQPKATAKLWHRLVQQRHTSARNADCSRLLFYAATDWLRLATKLAANQSPCAQYYISIPPLAADKTTFRPDQPWRIRALGANFHAVAEISYNGWGSWVAANGSTWYAAGVEARRRMAAQGFDIASGDTWVVNESSSAVRTGTGAARQNLRDLVRGLYDAGGAGPQVKGAVFVVGVGQSALSLSTYQGTLQLWYADTPFWADMNAYVSDWSQEVYGDIRNYAVPGAPPETRRDELNAWLQHPLALANAGPPEIATARAFLQATYSPLANAAWRYPSGAGFGWTDVPFDQMQDYVSAQTYALGSAGTHFGFAWHPEPTRRRRRHAVRDGERRCPRPDGGVDPRSRDGVRRVVHARDCRGVVQRRVARPRDVGDAQRRDCEHAYVADGRHAFRTADRSTADRRHHATRHAAGDGDASRRRHRRAASRAVSPGRGRARSTSRSPPGSTDATFYYRDTKAGTATIAASAPGRAGAEEVVTVKPGALAKLAVTPATATLTSGASRVFSASGTDGFGNTIAPSPSWAASNGRLSPTSGSSTTFTAGKPGKRNDQGAIWSVGGARDGEGRGRRPGRPDHVFDARDAARRHGRRPGLTEPTRAARIRAPGTAARRSLGRRGAHPYECARGRRAHAHRETRVLLREGHARQDARPRLEPRHAEERLLRDLSARSIWRSASRFARSRRLSRRSLPRASATSTFTLPSLK